MYMAKKLKEVEKEGWSKKAEYVVEQANSMEMEVMMSHSHETVMHHDDAQGEDASLLYRYKELFKNCFRYSEDYNFTVERESNIKGCMHSLQCIVKGRFSEVDISALEPFFPNASSNAIVESSTIMNCCMSLLMMRSSRARVPTLRKKETKEIGEHRLDFYLFREETHKLWKDIFKRDLTEMEWTLLQCVVQTAANDEKSVALLLSKLEIPNCLPNSVIRAIVALRLGPVDGPSEDVVIELAEKFGRRVSPALLNGMLCLCHPDSAALKCFPPLARQLKLVRTTANVFDGVLRLIKTSFPTPALAERIGVDNKLLAMIVSVASAKVLDPQKHGMILQMLCDRIGDAAKRRAAKEYKLPNINYANFNLDVVARLYDVFCGRNITSLAAGVMKTVAAETEEEHEAEQSLADLAAELQLPNSIHGKWAPSCLGRGIEMSLNDRLKILKAGVELPMEKFVWFEDCEVQLKREREARVKWGSDLDRRLKMVNSIATLCAPHEHPLRLEKHWAATALASRMMEKVGMSTTLGSSKTKVRRDTHAGASQSAVGITAGIARGGAQFINEAGKARIQAGKASMGLNVDKDETSSSDDEEDKDDTNLDAGAKKLRKKIRKERLQKERRQKIMFRGLMLLLRAGRLETEAIVGIARAVNRTESIVFTDHLRKVLTTFRAKNGKKKVQEDAKHYGPKKPDSSYADRILFFSEQIKESLEYAIGYCQKRGKRTRGSKTKVARPMNGDVFPLPETSIMPREFREGKAAPQLAKQIEIISQCMRIPGSGEADSPEQHDQAAELEVLMREYFASLATVFQLGRLAATLLDGKRSNTSFNQYLANKTQGLAEENALGAEEQSAIFIEQLLLIGQGSVRWSSGDLAAPLYDWLLGPSKDAHLDEGKSGSMMSGLTEIVLNDKKVRKAQTKIGERPKLTNVVTASMTAKTISVSPVSSLQQPKTRSFRSPTASTGKKEVWLAPS
jgi:hypothetical protein